jgi:hypothetical protein
MPLGPWNPGVKSRIPGRLLPLSTIFRSDNVFVDIGRVKELRDLTGLEFSELVTFRPARLALHELMIRVTADVSVSDGSRYEDLGINFRRIVSRIYEGCVQPNLAQIDASYQASRKHLDSIVAAELDALTRREAHRSEAKHEGRIRSMLRLRRGRGATPPLDASLEEDDTYLRAADDCDSRATQASDEARGAALKALARVLRAVYGKFGRVRAASDLVRSVAVDLACNSYASGQIGLLVDQYVHQAAGAEGYRLLPARDPAVVMNTKGPSASGKSTLRPLQHAMADRLGVQWSDFALISPDIWRKQLLDYASLGPDHRYGGMLTGEELAIIDRKLDRYVERKAEQGRISHLLIDRFRFGSFVFQSNRVDNRLLSRFGQQIYFFFMIAPPEALVERAWTRGLEYGRYKAVDDVLAHSVEAYAGIPQLYLSWASRTDKAVHFEFLDNSVAQGQVPRTVAFGWSDQLFVLDPKSLLDVVRFRRVNVDAADPSELFGHVAAGSMAPQSNAEFLLQCARQLREVVFADQASGRVYLRIQDGRPSWVDDQALERAAEQEDTRAALMAIAPAVVGRPAVPQDRALFVTDLLAADRIRTLGDWGYETNRVRA